MNEIYMKARAKVNLNLLVLNKREDNYHNIKSVFQKINLYDEMHVKKTNTFELQTNIKELNNKDNIIYKAYEKLKNKYDNITGVTVILKKNIPMQAGLAGGSTDCASFILCMNKLFDLNLSKQEMVDLGKSLGADVVPCFYNKALLVEGIGDKITKLNTNFKYYILIIKPKMSNSTKKMYEKLDSKNEIHQIDNTSKIICALENKNIKELGNNLYNVFESASDELQTIENIKEEFIKNGAEGSLMTGSGSCIYGLFENKKKAKKTYNVLKENYKVYICTSYNSNKEEQF